MEMQNKQESTKQEGVPEIDHYDIQEQQVDQVIEQTPIVVERQHVTNIKEVNPQIHRERQIRLVRPVIQRRWETMVQPQQVFQQQLPALNAEYRALSQTDVNQLVQQEVTRHLPPTQQGIQVEQLERETAPVVTETVQTRVIQEVVPIIERDVYQTQLLQLSQPILERVIEAPRVLPAVVQSLPLIQQQQTPYVVASESMPLEQQVGSGSQQWQGGWSQQALGGGCVGGYSQEYAPEMGGQFQQPGGQSALLGQALPQSYQPVSLPQGQQYGLGGGSGTGGGYQPMSFGQATGLQQQQWYPAAAIQQSSQYVPQSLYPQQPQQYIPTSYQPGQWSQQQPMKTGGTGQMGKWKSKHQMKKLMKQQK
ncbi:hypothetical protein MIR68_001103 [Amoeboaphelidium protococcarum]|nr:hypothetical protein MIR68_001103 [Amoeboaphelidium protococcarum]